MSKLILFEYVVLHHPKTKKNKNGEEVSGKSTIVTDLTRELAKDEKEIAMRIARALPEKYMDSLDEVEIIVRPFQG